MQNLNFEQGEKIHAVRSWEEKDGSQGRVIVYLLDGSETDYNEHLADLSQKPHSSPTPPPLLGSSQPLPLTLKCSFDMTREWTLKIFLE